MGEPCLHVFRMSCMTLGHLRFEISKLTKLGLRRSWFPSSPLLYRTQTLHFHRDPSVCTVASLTSSPQISGVSIAGGLPAMSRSRRSSCCDKTEPPPSRTPAQLVMLRGPRLPLLLRSRLHLVCRSKKPAPTHTCSRCPLNPLCQWDFF